MEYGLIYLILAAIFGLFMAWGIGANDVANAMATSVGSRVLTIKQAVFIAAIFEFAGAVLAGGEVTNTIRSGIIEVELLEDYPEELIFGMLAALLAAGTWLLIASAMGWPVSTTHSIVGAIMGFAITGLGWGAVHWPVVGSIVASWVISPVLAGCVAYMLFRSVQLLILDRRDPITSARRFVPLYIFATGFIMTLMTTLKGLQHVGLELGTAESCGIAVIVGATLAVGGKLVIDRIPIDPSLDREFHYTNVERIFAVLMVITACAMAFSHGSNDVANAIGPVAAVLTIVQSGEVAGKAPVPIWVLLLGAAGIVAGLLMLGHRVIATVGREITQLTPSRGFACELAAAGTVVMASSFGIPVSTTHTLVGAVLGVGLARGIAALNLSAVRRIFLSWVVTLPAGGILSVIFFHIMRISFS